MHNTDDLHIPWFDPLHIPRCDHLLTAALLEDALTVVANSAGIVATGLAARGMDGHEADHEAVNRTATYYRIDPKIVRAVCRAVAQTRRCDLATLAEECHQRGGPEMVSLCRAWLARRGTTNRLVRPFAQ
jgi:hypothetical protein